MSFDPVMMDLDNHIAKIEKEDARNAAIEEKSAEVYSALIAGSIIWVGKDNYSMDDFIADVDIDVCCFCSFMLGCSADLHSSMNERLHKFSTKIATEIVDGGYDE